MQQKSFNRRTFIKASSLAAAGLPFLTAPFQGLVMNNNYTDDIGLQLYTVREPLQQNSEGTLRVIKKLGYKQLELLDMLSNVSLLPLAKDMGLKVNSAFFSWPFITGNWELAKTIGIEPPSKKASFQDVIEAAEKNGLTHLVFGYLLPQERSQLDDWKKLIPKLNEAGAQCREAGIQLCYHNHSFEFQPLEDKIPFELLIEQLDPELVRFELDIFWASVGGQDPLQLLKRIADRTELLHLKDKLKDTPVTYSESEVKPETFKELGKGVLDLSAILKVASKANVTHLFVEQDASDAPFKSIETSYKYLQQLENQ